MGVVVFATLLGLAVLSLRRENAELGERIMRGIDTWQSLILRLVRIVIRLTPYGVLALMARITAMSNVNDIYNLGGFVVASYIGMGVILFTIIITGIYVRRANTEFDALTAEILAEEAK